MLKLYLSTMENLELKISEDIGRCCHAHPTVASEKEKEKILTEAFSNFSGSLSYKLSSCSRKLSL